MHPILYIILLELLWIKQKLFLTIKFDSVNAYREIMYKKVCFYKIKCRDLILSE